MAEWLGGGLQSLLRWFDSTRDLLVSRGSDLVLDREAGQYSCPEAGGAGLSDAGVAQLVERELPKLEVTGSRPVARLTGR